MSLTAYWKHLSILTAVAMHHLCTLARLWFWSHKTLRALRQCMISWQLWCRWGQEGTLCRRVISPVFHVSAEQCNKSLQMKILSWLEGNNSCWVLWHWPFKSCRSVWSRNTARILARVYLQLYNSNVFHTQEDFCPSLITCHLCLGGLCLSLEANDVQRKVPGGVM